MQTLAFSRVLKQRQNIVGCTRLALYMEFARLLFCVPDDGRVRNRDGSKKGAANFCDETVTVKE